MKYLLFAILIASLSCKSGTKIQSPTEEVETQGKENMAVDSALPILTEPSYIKDLSTVGDVNPALFDPNRGYTNVGSTLDLRGVKIDENYLIDLGVDPKKFKWERKNCDPTDTHANPASCANCLKAYMFGAKKRIEDYQHAKSTEK